jgi:hypothetical protein
MSHIDEPTATSTVITPVSVPETIGYATELRSHWSISASELVMIALRLLGAYVIYQGIMFSGRVAIYLIGNMHLPTIYLAGDFGAILFMLAVGGALWRWAAPLGGWLLSRPIDTAASKAPGSIQDLLSAGLSFLAILIATSWAIPGILSNLALVYFATRNQSAGDAIKSYEPALVRDIGQLFVAIWLFLNSKKLSQSWSFRQKAGSYRIDSE